ncbi:hypothetical protein TNCT_383481 [Trichonephila clavata]|uniref:FHOD1 N-terminal GTPase-binding domain-containing protein n=1 Tax=Trichonephila clavata TaxID=2740835 RepID=A0A8X6F1K2_TRICU|nr:hypothetical protein TNCT_383481 [Trichonephila clavata]
MHEIDDKNRVTPSRIPIREESALDDCTLQLYRYNGSEGDYGNYLDPESTIDEQAEDFEDFHQKETNK